MIIAVITALAAMQAVGGLDYLVHLAQRLLRSRPQSVTFLAPAVTCALVAASGTQHVIYALLPVIAEVSRGANIRPEHPLSISVIAAQHGLVASPVSAATVAIVGVLAGADVGLGQIVAVILPSTFLAVAAGALSVAWKGPPLGEDPLYRERLESGAVEAMDAPPAFEAGKLGAARGATLLRGRELLRDRPCRASDAMARPFPPSTMTSASGRPIAVPYGWSRRTGCNRRPPGSRRRARG
jgi:anaerobic C4-dicarboxylate transporter DcuA